MSDKAARWQLTVADLDVLHTHGGADLRGVWVCDKLNELDAWMKEIAPASVYVEWAERMKALMGVMVVGEEWIGEDDEEGFPPDCNCRYCRSVH